MDPMTLLVSALVGGASEAVKATATAAVKDAYAALKGLLTRKLGGKKASLDSLEEKPESESRRTSVKEDLSETRAAADPEVMATAQQLVVAIQRDAPALGPALGIDFEKVSAGFLQVGKISSEGTGARLRDANIAGGIVIGEIIAGKKGSGNP
jgi:hypothetical protein